MSVVNCSLRVQELCESRGGRPGLPVNSSPSGVCSELFPQRSGANSPPGLCGGRKATLNMNFFVLGQELCESRGGRPGLPVPNSPYGLCGREAAVNTV